MEQIFLKLIKTYQKLISPFLGQRCRFYPSCSEYTYLAVKKYGALIGCWRGFKRILKCHPLNPGGVELP